MKGRRRQIAARNDSPAATACTSIPEVNDHEPLRIDKHQGTALHVSRPSSHRGDGIFYLAVHCRRP